MNQEKHIQLQGSKNLRWGEVFVFVLALLTLVLCASTLVLNWLHGNIGTDSAFLLLLISATCFALWLQRRKQIQQADPICGLHIDSQQRLTRAETLQGNHYRIQHYQCHKLFRDYIELELEMEAYEVGWNGDSAVSQNHQYDLHIYADMLSADDMSRLRCTCLLHRNFSSGEPALAGYKP